VEDRELRLASGWLGVAWILFLLAAIVGLIVLAARWHEPLLVAVIVPLFIVWIVSWFGFIVNGPNQSRVVQFFGKYVGTVSQTGFFYGNPFYWRTQVSLRVQVFETGMSKTEDTKDAAGRVIAAGTSHRENLATRYSYDAPDTDAHSLRGHIEEVAGQLKHDLQVRMRQAGVEVQEARISYLAYAREIASAMLQRQQAGAIIAARSLIVAGAVGMVEHALQMLSERHIVDLDPERRAAMVSNLLVVLCGHTVPQPVLNTGTLYN
jgi:hypothetical protein